MVESALDRLGIRRDAQSRLISREEAVGLKVYMLCPQFPSVFECRVCVHVFVVLMHSVDCVYPSNVLICDCTLCFVSIVCVLAQFVKMPPVVRGAQMDV